MFIYHWVCGSEMLSKTSIKDGAARLTKSYCIFIESVNIRVSIRKLLNLFSKEILTHQFWRSSSQVFAISIHRSDKLCIYVQDIAITLKELGCKRCCSNDAYMPASFKI